ncbi:hypothetical protein EUX98_g6250 [Antrodiella citrinella]|uniref:Uncharacterized protein n=1 Tax=Antrodiella citrinella TaxID=2447956 RepID=A0A4S4MPF8_9APHY|nr:hypothetical protein EUX98_g6250 [Antrodiella citrinella]
MVNHRSCNVDDNPRATKRIKLDGDFGRATSTGKWHDVEDELPTSSLSTLTASAPSTPTTSLNIKPESDVDTKLKPLSPSALLTALPGLLMHPPNHKSYLLSLEVSMNALRRCLDAVQHGQAGMAPETECRAWTGLAEVGMRLVGAGMGRGVVEAEVDRALSKAGMISQKHPSLRPFKLHVSLLQAQFSHWQHRTKFARTQIRTLIASMQPSDPPYIVYSAHLAAIALFTTPHTPTDPTVAVVNAASSSRNTTPTKASYKAKSTPIRTASPATPQAPSTPKQSPQDINAALAAVQTMQNLSHERRHAHVTLLCLILRLRILVAAEMWADVAGALQAAETALGVEYVAGTTPKATAGKGKEREKEKEKETFVMFEDEVSTMRSEFDEAEKHLAQLIAHTRTYGLFPHFSARITLHHAHLAHALARPSRADQCYVVAAGLAPAGTFVNVSARAGRVLLHLGWKRNADDDDEGEGVDEEEMKEVVRLCRGLGGTLEAVGRVVEACLSTEIMKSKQHLKAALHLATQSQDNHLRALILALIASQYFYTAGDHAQQMLQTCEQLAAGLGAPPASNAEPGAVLGNVPLGLWVGERFLELYNRAGKTARAEKQTAANAQYAKALETLKNRR